MLINIILVGIIIILLVVIACMIHVFNLVEESFNVFNPKKDKNNE
jgi:hypothetical protein